MNPLNARSPSNLSDFLETLIDGLMMAESDEDKDQYANRLLGMMILAGAITSRSANFDVVIEGAKALKPYVSDDLHFLWNKLVEGIKAQMEPKCN